MFSPFTSIAVGFVVDSSDVQELFGLDDSWLDAQFMTEFSDSSISDTEEHIAIGCKLVLCIKRMTAACICPVRSKCDLEDSESEAGGGESLGSLETQLEYWETEIEWIYFLSCDNRLKACLCFLFLFSLRKLIQAGRAEYSPSHSLSAAATSFPPNQREKR